MPGSSSGRSVGSTPAMYPRKYWYGQLAQDWNRDAETMPSFPKPDSSEGRFPSNAVHSLVSLESSSRRPRLSG